MIAVPKIFENSEGGTRSMDVFTRLLSDRIIMLTGAVDDDMAQVACAEMLFLDAQKQSPIYLYINSPGGSVTDGLAIYDVMMFVSSPVITVCVGQAASMGAILLATGNKRYSLPHGQIMIHQPSTGISGQCTDIQIYARQTQYYKEMLNEMLSSRTKKSVAEMAALTERDSYLTPEQALEIGLIDGIIRSRKEMR